MSSARRKRGEKRRGEEAWPIGVFKIRRGEWQEVYDVTPYSFRSCVRLEASLPPWRRFRVRGVVSAVNERRIGNRMWTEMWMGEWFRVNCSNFLWGLKVYCYQILLLLILVLSLFRYIFRYNYNFHNNDIGRKNGSDEVNKNKEDDV